MRLALPSQRRFCRPAYSSSRGGMKERNDSPISGSCSLLRSVRLLRSLTLNTWDEPVISPPTAGFVDVEEVGSVGAKPVGLDHLPDAGAPRGCMKEAEGLGTWSYRGESCGCLFRLCGIDSAWIFTLACRFCGSGLAHFEIGGAHFPRPAGVVVVSSEGGAAGLLSGTSHVPGRAVTCAR